MKTKLFLLLIGFVFASCTTTTRTAAYSSSDSSSDMYYSGMKHKTSTAKKKISQPSRTRCAAVTKKGVRCSRYADSGSSYCWQHRR